ncbi:hypothetical protein [Streptomyces sp. NPDC088358]|uniref:hypothetical protein n=1 Tax=Streptomyces sp. NPDC088358 TaxID=3365857 RepID=UPI003812E364
MARKKASEGSGIVWCHGRGSTCIAFAEDRKETAEPEFLSPFARADQSSPVYDATLNELSDNLNGLVRGTQNRSRAERGKDPELKIGFLATGAGFLPVWKREVRDSERLEDLVAIESLTDLDSMTSDQLDTYLRIDNEDGENGGEWRSHRVSGGVIRCKGNGMSCFVTTLKPSEDSKLIGKYFPAVAQDSPVHDPSLDELTVKLNSLVNETQTQERQKSNRDPKAQIGFVITGHGLLPAWKIVLPETDGSGDDADSEDLDAMTDAQRDQFLGVKP